MTTMTRSSLPDHRHGPATIRGGKFHHKDDDQETPDTNIACFDFRDRMISREGCRTRAHLTQSPVMLASKTAM